MSKVSHILYLVSSFYDVISTVAECVCKNRKLCTSHKERPYRGDERKQLAGTPYLAN